MIVTPQEVSIERAMGLIKGGFSHRSASSFPVWQRGFTDHRIRDAVDMETRRKYLHMNPVCAGLVTAAEQYRYSSAYGGVEGGVSANARRFSDFHGTSKRKGRSKMTSAAKAALILRLLWHG